VLNAVSRHVARPAQWDSPLRRASATLPVAEADVALTGRRVPWFQEWICHGSDDPYWQATDHRHNVERMPPVVYLQSG
jgi:hypothetical protein